MSKARVDWTHREVISSAKLNQMILDDMRRGELVLHSASYWDTGFAQGVNGAGAGAGVDLGWFPYHPDKSVFDRLRIFGFFDAAAVATALQYSLDSGVTHVTLGAFASGTAFTFGMGGAAIGSATARYWDVDLSSITSFKYVGVRVALAAGAPAYFTWNLQAFMYNSTDTPF